MSIFDRARPTLLADLVFASPELKVEILAFAKPARAKNLLLYGPRGSGKSEACSLIAKALVGDGYGTDVRTINVPRDSSKGVLMSAIEDFNGTPGLNDLGKVVFVLEEIDGADASAQRALKFGIEEQQKTALFIATTNHLHMVNDELKDRFHKIHVPVPSEEAWARRAQHILAMERVKATPEVAANVLRQYSAYPSTREYLRALDRFADEVHSANSTTRP